MSALSPLRAKLASFENAYSVATRLRAATGRVQFIVRTEDPLQPFRVATSPPRRESQLTTVIA